MTQNSMTKHHLIERVYLHVYSCENRQLFPIDIRQLFPIDIRVSYRIFLGGRGGEFSSFEYETIQIFKFSRPPTSV